MHSPPNPQSAEVINKRMREMSDAVTITPDVTSKTPMMLPFKSELSVLGINAANTENSTIKAHIIAIASHPPLTELTRLDEIDDLFTFEKTELFLFIFPE